MYELRGVKDKTVRTQSRMQTSKRQDRPNTIQDTNIQKRLEVTIICTFLLLFQMVYLIFENVNRTDEVK